MSFVTTLKLGWNCRQDPKKKKVIAISNNEHESRHTPYNASPFSTCSNSEGDVSIE
jgi:hypothetical protein